MRDLRGSLTMLAERGGPLTSGDLRERVAFDLAEVSASRGAHVAPRTAAMRGTTVAIAAFVAIVATIGLVTWLGRSIVTPPASVVTTSLPPPTLTTVPSTTPAPTTTIQQAAPVLEPEEIVYPELTWTRIDSAIPGSEGIQTMGSVIHDGARFVAVGSEETDAGGRAAVWISSDGIEWSRVDNDESVFGGTGMEDVVAGGPGYVAVGTDWSEPFGSAHGVVWTSVDGEIWNRSDSDDLESVLPFSGVYSVIAGGPGLVAVGWDFDTETFEGNAAVWTSSDGFSWDRVPDPDGTFSRALMSDVVAYEGGYVAVGSGRGQLFVGTRGCTDGDICPAAAWTSPDAVTWTRIESSTFVGGFTEASNMSVSGPNIVAGGFDVGVASIWTYDPDGGWVRVPHTGPLFGESFAVDATALDGDRAIAVGSRGNWETFQDDGTFVEGDAIVWVSADRGLHWERADWDKAFTTYMDPMAVMLDIVVVDGTFFVVGAVGDDEAVWIGQWANN